MTNVAIECMKSSTHLGSSSLFNFPLSVQLEQDRNQVIDASIVRLMKSRKRLDHNSIVAEVTQQLASRFNPAPAAIKKRIETLLERDYLSRDEDDRRIYFYVA